MERVTACRSSGLSVKAWCRQEGICVQTYYRWEREVVGRVSTKEAQESRELSIKSGGTGIAATFEEVPITMYAKTERNRLIAVVKSGQTEVELYEGASEELLSAIIVGLNHA